MANQLASVPDSVGDLRLLYRLGLKDNQLVCLPSSLGRLSSLVELFLTGNQIQALPESLGGMVSLVKLQASFNQLQSLPASIQSLQKLELLRVAVNCIHQVILWTSTVMQHESIADQVMSFKHGNLRTGEFFKVACWLHYVVQIISAVISGLAEIEHIGI